MTQQFAIDFDWYRCPDGYHFATEAEFLDRYLEWHPPVPDAVPDTPDQIVLYMDRPKSIPKTPRQTELLRQARQHIIREDKVDLDNPNPVSIVPNSEERIPYSLLDEYDSPIKMFARTKTPEDLLKFTTRWGPLRSKSEVGESIKYGLGCAQMFRDLLACKSRGPKKMASVFEAQLPKNWNGQPTAERLVGTIHIIPDLSRGIRLRLTTDSLLNAMWWEFNQKIAGETIFRVCRQCGKPFEAGPGGDARIDAKFCGHECSVRFHSLRRSKGA
jgi:hypothetical protein